MLGWLYLLGLGILVSMFQVIEWLCKVVDVCYDLVVDCLCFDFVKFDQIMICVEVVLLLVCIYLIGQGMWCDLVEVYCWWSCVLDFGFEFVGMLLGQVEFSGIGMVYDV